MKFTKLPISGAYIVELEKREDGRGFLARTYDKSEFNKYGINLDILQGYTCKTNKQGTLRGLHFMKIAETKVTRVIAGTLFEVILDLRPGSITYKKWFGREFCASDYKLLVTPPGCAHAVLTLADDTEYIAYYNPNYNPEYERGIRWDDPMFDIKWPIKPKIISQKDQSWPDYLK